jgi:ribosomal protein S18 acetylase RimI-like enzyme
MSVSYADGEIGMSLGEIHFRRAGVEDAQAIAAFGARTFAETFAPYNDRDDIQRYLSSNFSEPQIASELLDPGTIFLLAYDQETLIGYAKLRQGKVPDCVIGSKPVELERIYVENSLIGRGYGSALMKECFREALRIGYETMWLGVWEKNDQAIGFYERWGFRKVGTQEFILGGDVQSDWVMQRSLDVEVERGL